MFLCYKKIIALNLMLFLCSCSNIPDNFEESYRYVSLCKNKACIKTSKKNKASYKNIDYTSYIYKDIYDFDDDDYIKVKKLYDKISIYNRKLNIDDLKEIDSVVDFLYKDLKQLISIYNFSNYSSELENIDLYRSDNAFLVKELQFLELLQAENNRQYRKLKSVNNLDESQYKLYIDELKEQYYHINDNIDMIKSVVLNNITNIKGLIKFFEYARVKYEK
ncbi:hypothetical protein [Photobacterium damselae]|uniref:hypothetical protein n=1 Tax=Photobacterium damselae TaxID=38293 RepID=UPI0040679B65